MRDSFSDSFGRLLRIIFHQLDSYYIGMINAPVILGLTIPPCLAFLFFAIDRKNGIAIIPIVIFTLCHLIYGVVNFII